VTAEEVIRLLELRAHPEGGYFNEVFRSPRLVAAQSGARSASTAIYFLLRAGEFSALHRVRSDEAWHHYAGDALELVILEGNAIRRERLGRDLAAGERPFAIVPADAWQAARPIDDTHGYALVGCTVAPGFDFADFRMADRDALMRNYPAEAELIRRLTR
jgi:hypothetical protein